MHIKNLKISNMGYIKSTDLRFESNNINVIQGINGSGKTTVLAVLYSMFQDEETLKYKSNQRENAQIAVSIENQGKNYELVKHYLDGDPKILVNSFNEMRQLTSIDYDKVFLYSGEFTRDTYWLSDSKIKMALDLLNNLNIKEENLFDMYSHKDTKYRFVSQGYQIYLTILSILATMPNGSIFLCDDPFASLDMITAEKIYDLMEKLEGIQFILTANSRLDIDRPFHKIELLDNGIFHRNANLTFNYERFFYKDVKEKLSAFDANSEQISDAKPIIKYRLNELVNEEENRNVEFKEIKGNNPCESIISNAEIYIIAYLNSWETGYGIIKWGISDEGRTRGVKLLKEDRDNIRKKLTERISQVKPYISQDLLHISFEAIIDDSGDIIPEVYVVEIAIEVIKKEELFSTSKGEVYIKTEGGKIKLSPYEIQQELKRRFLTQ